MELRHLRSFIAVAEERHFGRAATRLHIAQPHLSQTIRRLEAELGVPLLHRTTRRVELAPAGEILLERGRRILETVERADDDVARAGRGEFGRLSIGFTGSATYAILRPLAAALHRDLAGVALDLHGEMLTPAQVSGLNDGTLDLGILRPPVNRSGLMMEPVLREPLVAVLPHGHRLADSETIGLEELADEPFVTYPSQLRSVLHEVVERACAAHGFRAHSAIEVTETATLLSFVAAGVGVSLVPASTSQMTIAGAVYRPLRAPAIEVELALAWRPDRRSALLDAALAIVRRELAAMRAAPPPALGAEPRAGAPPADVEPRTGAATPADAKPRTGVGPRADVEMRADVAAELAR
ncbi:MAG: LysR family transcriptional regulator [Solirubrobacteraceae bacterium]